MTPLKKLETIKLLEEGIALVNKYDTEFPDEYFSEILEYLDMEKSDFWHIVDSFRNPLFWKQN